MLDKDTLANLSAKPTIDQITLKVLQEYYEKYIVPYVYTYEIDSEESIELKFNPDNFCHLLGIETIAKGSKSVPASKVSNYKGNKGYQMIKNEQITKESLKPLHKTFYNDSKKKMVWFYLLDSLLNAPQAVHYKKKINRISSVDILFFDLNQNAYIHLGIIKTKKDSNQYAPTTFLIEPITKMSNGKKFIDGQPSITVNKYEKKSIKNIIT